MKKMLTNIRGVLFDLDGTLVDSMWIWKDIDIDFLKEYGYDLPEDLQECIAGMSFTETAHYFKNRFLLPLSVDEIKDCWIKMSLEMYTTRVFLKSGVDNFLQMLKGMDIKMGIATSNSRKLVEQLLDGLNIRGYFETVRTSCEVKKGKPAPDIYLTAASDLHLHPEECLVFEDIPNGILAGKSAGMSVCAVWDESSADQESICRSHADFYIKDFNDILERTNEVL